MDNARELIMRDIAVQEEARAAKLDKEPKRGLLKVPQLLSAAVQAGIAAGNINLSSGPTGERLGLSENAQAAVDKQDDRLAEFERKRQLRSIFVPTGDREVKRQLRSLLQPICLFGEDAADRRDRLRGLLEKLGAGALKRLEEGGLESQVKEETQGEVWYHEGPQELKQHRIRIAEESLGRSRERLKKARLKLAHGDSAANAERQQLHNKLRTLGNYCSQVGCTRPLSACQFSPDGQMLATASWSGLCKLWSVPDAKQVKQLRGHNQRVGAIVWHPKARISQEPSALNLVSCDASGTVRCWSTESEEPIASLEGHEKRVSRVAFHPSGNYLGSACYDHSWRLWDMNTKTEILHQEGHSKPVYTVCFHKDGSLAGTGGLDCHARIWDLRSGKNVLTLQGHIKDILAMDFSPNGYHCVTGSEDNTIRLWDLRQRKSVYTIGAHNNLVSSLKYSADGETLVSTSFDQDVKIWAMPACTPLKTLKGHEGRVMSCDISPDSKYIVSASYDRTFKLWAAE